MIAVAATGNDHFGQDLIRLLGKIVDAIIHIHIGQQQFPPGRRRDQSYFCIECAKNRC